MREAQDAQTAQLDLPVPAIAGLVGTPASIPLHLIDAEDQVRTTSGIDDSLDELADSIKARGVLAPILVRQATAAGRFVLIAGHRRTLAANIAGLDVIPAIIAQADVDQALEMQLAENIQREQLNLSELAAAVRRLFDNHGDLAKVADVVKKSKSWVSKHLALSYPEFSHTAKYLLMSGVTQDLELLHAVNQIEKTRSLYWELSNLVDQIKAGKAGRKEARDLLAKAKERKEADKAAEKKQQRARPAMPAPIDPLDALRTAARDLRDADDKQEVDEILAAMRTEAIEAIDAALPSDTLADSHAKGAALQSAAPGVQLRALAASCTYFGIDRAAFIVGLVGLQLTARNYLVEVREISRIDLED